MALRILRQGCKGEDVRVIQKALNRRGAGLNTDGDFGNHTRDAVSAFQQKNALVVDGEVGPQTRRALFPLVAVTVNVLGTRMTGSNSGRPTGSPLAKSRAPGFGLPPLSLPPLTPPSLQPLLTVPPLTLQTPNLVRVPGLFEPIPAAPVFATSLSNRGPDWQQFAQTQRQFTGLFRGPFVDSFGVGIQAVFNRIDDDNHVELATGCLLQSPIGIQDGQGNNLTLACFANATWVDPILHRGMFHLANPYAQVQGQGNTSGPVLPTSQIGLFPVNINVDLNDDGLQLNFNGGATWSLTFDGNSVTSTWGTALGLGVVGKFRSF
jgi:hypothetical protein